MLWDAPLPINSEFALRRSKVTSRSCERLEHGARNCATTVRRREPVDDNSIDPETPAVLMDRKDQLQHEQEELGPRQLALGIIEAEPEIEDLQRPDRAPEAYENTKHEGPGGQYLEAIDGRCEKVEMRQDDIVDEIGLERDRR